MTTAPRLRSASDMEEDFVTAARMTRAIDLMLTHLHHHGGAEEVDLAAVLEVSYLAERAASRLLEDFRTLLAIGAFKPVQPAQVAP